MDYHGTSGDDILDQAKLGLENGSQIFGGAGNDTITIGMGVASGEAGNDTIVGTSDFSTASYQESPKAVNVNLATGVAEDGFGTVDKLTNIHIVTGSNFDDLLVGSPGNEEFWGQRGSNTIVGGGGVDTARYYGVQTAERKITYDAATDTFTVTKNTPAGGGDLGTDILKGISALKFSNPDSPDISFTKYDVVGDFQKISNRSTFPEQAWGVNAFKAGDFNGDGLMDVVVVQQVATGTRAVPMLIYLGDGKGQFVESSASTFSNGSPSVNPGGGRTLVADVNRDGISDIFQEGFGNDAPPFPGGTNLIFLSSPTTGKLEDVSSSLRQTPQLNHGVSGGDVNGDSYIDVLVSTISSAGTVLLINDGKGHFADRSDLVPHGGTAASVSAILDIDGDGFTDIVLGRGGGDASVPPSQVLLNDGSGDFTKITPIDLLLSGVFYETVLDIKAIDLNGDNLPDLMVDLTSGGVPETISGLVSTTFYRTPYIQLLINDGGGHFHDETSSRLPQKLAALESWYFSVASVDFNHDGFADIVASGTGVNSSTVWLNRGDGTFYEYWKSAPTAQVTVGDMNNDGMSDLVTYLDHSISAYQNDLPNGHIYKANFGGDQLQGSTGADVMTGRAGDDTFIPGGGIDTVDGGLGLDTAIYGGGRSNYTLTRTAIGFTLADRTGANGTDLISNLERLKFGDSNLALDLDGNAGKVAKLLGAVLGAGAVSNKQYVGLGLSLLDSGMSYETLTGLALTAAGATTPQQVVNLLYQNILGSTPSASDARPFVDLLSNGMSAGALGVLAAETDLNASHINLVGLRQTGLEYAVWIG